MIRLVALGAVVVWRPSLAVLGAVAVAGARLRAVLGRRAEARRSAAAADADVMVLAELTALGLSAGLTLTGALQAAAAVVAPPLAAEVGTVLRRSAHSGSERALAAAGGRLDGLGRLVARAQATGAPLVEVVEGFAAAERDRARAERLAAGRRLPVLLLVPLALLILPGFVLLVAGPALLGGLARLGL